MNNMNFGELMRICGIGLLAAFSAVILRDLRKEYTAVILLGMSVAVLLVIVPKIGEAVSLLQELESKVSTEHIGMIIRAVGVTYLTGSACEICRSAGEQGIAGTIETVGRAELLVMCIPLFRELMEMALLRG